MQFCFSFLFFYFSLITFQLDDLIAGIKGDIDYAKEQLEKPENQQYKSNPFFLTKKQEQKDKDGASESTNGTK
jgi:hypothetical protein